MGHDRTVLFQGAIPKHYDRYLGPVMFEPFARDIARRFLDRKIQSLLEIACGTGIVARRLRDTVPLRVPIIATDLNPDMFQFAKRKFRDGENVYWQRADACALPFPNGAFDAVVCQFGLMFVPEKDVALRESHRVLSHSGVLLFNVWDSFEANPFAKIAHATIRSFFKSDPPKFYDIPFNPCDLKLIRELLRGAGFERIESFVESRPCRANSAKEFATGLIRGNSVAAEATERGVDPEDLVVAVANRIAERFGDAPVESTMRAIVWHATTKS